MPILGMIVYWMFFWMAIGLVGLATVYKNKIDATKIEGIAAYVLLLGPIALIFVVLTGFLMAIEELSKYKK